MDSEADEHLSWEDFLIAAQQWTRLGEKYGITQPLEWDWKWLKVDMDLPNNGYLVMKDIVRLEEITIARDVRADLEVPTEECQCVIDDVACNIADINNPSKRNFCYEYHILYSATYKVPVLYYRAFDTANGEPLCWRNIRKNLPEELKHKNQWNFITNEEHPLLGEPFFMIHPCQTAEIVKLMHSTFQYVDRQHYAVSYLLQWYAMLSPITGIRVPPEFYSRVVMGWEQALESN